MSTATPVEATVDRRAPLFKRLPVISHFNKSVGLQRGMLVVGLVLTGTFLLTAIFAPLLAPYGVAQLSDADGSFPTQQPPGGKHLLGTTVGGYDVLSRVIWGAQTAILVILVAVVLNLQPDTARNARVDLKGCGLLKGARALIYAGDPNGFAEQQAAAVSSGIVETQLPPWSITVLDLTLEPSKAPAKAPQAKGRRPDAP